jgi:hypothetical protein
MLALSDQLYMKAVICKMILSTEMGFVDETGNTLKAAVQPEE